MYQENELKKLYERLKAQYPQYQLEFSGDGLILKRLYCKVEVNRFGAKLYVNGNLYDQFTSEDVDDSDDLYELIEAFLLDIQHAGMEQGNETYITSTKQAAKIGSHFLVGTALCLTILMIGLITANSPWLFLLIFLLPASSLVVLKLIRKRIFQRYWICPACAQPLPMGEGSRFCEMDYVPQCPHCAHMLEQPPELAAIQTEYDPQKPLEPAYDLPIPGSKWPCLISGGITTVFALLLLPLIFIPDGSKPLDMMGGGSRRCTAVYSSRIWNYTAVLPPYRAGRNPTTDRHCAGTENCFCAWGHPVGTFLCYAAGSRYCGRNTSF